LKNLEKGRDFIDFLILVYRRQKTFYFLLLVFFAMGAYFNNFHNTKYKFNMELQVSLKDNYFDTDNFQRQLNKTVNEINSVDGDGSSTDLEALNNLLWSRDEVRVLIKTLPMNGIFFSELASEYIKNSYLIDQTEVESRINASLSYKDKGDYGLIVFASLDDLDLGRFLEDNFITIMEKHISNRMKTHLLNLKANALTLFESKANIAINKRVFQIKENDMIENNSLLIDQLLADPMRNSIYADSYYFIDSMEVPAYNLAYIDNTQTSISKSNRVNPLFVYVFLIFIALFFHIVISIFIDLLDQIKKRIEE
jgi:hypothetical protein